MQPKNNRKNATTTKDNKNNTGQQKEPQEKTEKEKIKPCSNRATSSSFSTLYPSN